MYDLSSNVTTAILAQEKLLNNQVLLLKTIDDKIFMLNNNMLASTSALNTSSFLAGSLIIIVIIVVGIIAIKTNVDVRDSINALARRNTEEGLAMVNQIGDTNQILLSQIRRNTELIAELNQRLDTYHSEMDSWVTENIISNLQLTEILIPVASANLIS